MSTSTAIAIPVKDSAATPAAWEALARLLEYPGPDFASRLMDAALEVPKLGEPAAHAWERFSSAFWRLSPEEREEWYTATFDLRPSCVPYVSIHLFGEENFQRGQFMAALMERYAACGFATGGELPDHLAVLLRFAARTDDAERRELAQFCMLGPLRRMRESLSEEHPYRALLETVEAVVRHSCPGVEPAPRPVSSSPQGACGGCSCSAPMADGINPGTDEDL